MVEKDLGSAGGGRGTISTHYQVRRQRNQLGAFKLCPIFRAAD